jgi:hypothetical protein
MQSREAISFTSNFAAWHGFHRSRRAVRFDDGAAFSCIYRR